MAGYIRPSPALLNTKATEMNSRRQFVKQSTLAATAIVALKPLDTLASFTSPFAGSSLKQVTFLHTTMPGTEIVSTIKRLQQNHRNPVLLHAGKTEETTRSNYDAATGSLPEHFEGAYQIVYKGSVKIGVIEANASGPETVDYTNQLADFLKKEKNCQLVVCLSSLGFRNRTSIDDTRLAEKSENLDIIIGKKTITSPPLPYIALNKQRSEVILHYSDSRETIIGNMKIFLNDQGAKQRIEFDNPFHPKGRATA